MLTGQVQFALPHFATLIPAHAGSPMSYRGGLAASNVEK
jgi:hypothetical protein